MHGAAAVEFELESNILEVQADSSKEELAQSVQFSSASPFNENETEASLDFGEDLDESVLQQFEDSR